MFPGGDFFGTMFFVVIPIYSSLSAGETIPGSAVPDNAQRGTDADWKSWIKQKYMSVAHPVGTAAMMKRSLGG